MLTGRTIALRSLNTSDYHALYQLAMSGAITTWRNLARTLPPDQFPFFLWDGVYLQKVICRRDDPNGCLGLVTIFNEDGANQVAYLSAIVDPAAPDLAGGEAVALLLRHVFETTAFRKIYAETSELSLPFLADGNRLPGTVEEGRLVGHLLRGGRAYDLVVLAVHRDRFLADTARILALLDRDRDQEFGGPRAAATVEWRQFLTDLATAFPFVKERCPDLEATDGGTRFVEDLGIDSLGLIEIAAWAEDRYRVVIPDELLGEVRCLQDAFHAIHAIHA